jgi:hypothetical protein
LKRADSPLKIKAPRERSKKIKKIIDDLAAILSVTRTSADASRYFMCGKGGWPHKPTKPVASNGEKRLAESLNPGDRANEINTQSLNRSRPDRSHGSARARR